MAVRIFSPGWLALVVVLAPPQRASADEREGSLHLEVAPAVVRAEDAQGLGAHANHVGGRVSFRGTYGVSDRLAIEVGAGGLWASGEIPDQSYMGHDGTLAQDELSLRITAGASLRFGVEWVPTLTAQVGYQRRMFMKAALVDAAGFETDTIDTAGLNDLLVLGGVGLDYRLNARWAIGGSIQVVHAFSLDGNSFDSIEVPLHVAYYSYSFL